MAAHAGDTAEETGDFRYAHCPQTTQATTGHTIPACPRCGHKTFDTRRHEPGRHSS